MLLTFIYVIVFFLLLKGTTSEKRRNLSIITLIVYLSISIIDLIYLQTEYHRSFHFSDPEVYYRLTYAIDFLDIWNIESSNTFYLIINWYYNHFYDNPVVCSFLLKLNNAFVIVISYLLLTNKVRKVSFLDYLLLFNPYLIMTIIRNVRDAYIILFVAVILLSLQYFNKAIKKKYLLVGGGLLAITRPILFVPIALISVLKIKKRGLRNLLLIIGFFLVLANISSIIGRVASQAVSALDFVGEDVTDFIPLIHGEYSLGVILTLLKRLFIGFVSFVCTPHPVNYIETWLGEMDVLGTYNIYTGFDNLLVSLGSVYTYVFVMPIAVCFVLSPKRYNYNMFWFILLYAGIYTVAYIGISDIRNRHFMYFWLLITMICSEKKPKLEKQHFFIVLALFVLIGIV